MKIVDRIAKFLTNIYISAKRVDITTNFKSVETEEIMNDIKYLKELKHLLVEKDNQIKKQVIEWDRTFDSIIDNIVIINNDLMVTKTNKNFVECMNHFSNSDIKDYSGKFWNDIQSMMNIPQHDTTVHDCIKTGVTQELYNTRGDKSFYVLVNPVFFDDKVIGAVRISRDITKIEEQKSLLQGKNILLQSIVNITHELESEKLFDEKIYNVLKEIGNTVKADRSYIYYNKTEMGRLCATFGHEWCSDSFEKCNTAINDCINFDVLISWREDLSSGKTIIGNTLKCNNCTNKNICETNTDGRFSVCAVPIFVNKEWIGFIGFDYISEKNLIEDEEYILRVAADILGNVLSNYNKRE